MAGRVSQDVVEGVVLPTSAAARVSQDVLEAVVSPDKANARISQLVIEVVIGSPSVVSNGEAGNIQSNSRRLRSVGGFGSRGIAFGSRTNPSVVNSKSHPDPIRSCANHDSVFAGPGAIGLKFVSWPVAAIMQNGHPGVLFNARAQPYAAADDHAYFVAHNSPGFVEQPIKLYSYSNRVLGLVSYRGKLVAIGSNAAALGQNGDLVYRVSSDSGKTWTAEATLIAGFSRAYACGIVNQDVGFWATTNRAGDALYVFYYQTGTNTIKYRTTSNADPSAGWSGELSANFITGQPGFNAGNDVDEGTSYRAFMLTETVTPGTWALHCQDGTGILGDNKALYTGTLGGAWGRVLSLGFGGGLTGFAGACGGVFVGKEGRLITYAFTDDVTDVDLYTGSADAVNFSLIDEVPTAPQNRFGQGQGLYVPKYGVEMIWGHSRADLAHGDGVLRMVAIDGLVTATELFGGN